VPIRDYGVLKGRPVVGELRARGRNQPHFHIKLDAGGRTFDIAVNVESVDGSEVLYHVEHDLHPPDPDGLIRLADGFTGLAGRHGWPPNPLALDFVRERLVEHDQMHLLGIGVQAGRNDLQNEVADLTGRIDANPDAKLYAFGSQFPSGIHDIHMNQGNPADSFGGDNGTFQDGALFVHLPSQDRWLAVFIAFQTQSWNTDDRGNPAGDPGAEGSGQQEPGHHAPARPHGGGRPRHH
jgi:uncharacterized protein YukJ